MVTQFRLRVIFFLTPFFALFIVSRLFYWQIIRGPGLAQRADRQHQDVVVLASQRGDILDSSGELLAGTQNLYHLFVYQPQLEKDKAEVINLLAPVLATSAATLDQTRSQLLDRLNLTSNWVSLKHYLTPDQKQAIEALNLKGLGFEDEFTRFYPEASLAAQVLGFVGSDLAGEPQGYFGLEGYFDRQMHGREGKVRSEKDAFGNPILIGRYNLLSNITGRSIVTTIRKQTQFLVESLLRDGLTRYQAKAGNVIIMESATGKILAMAAYPNYDPGHFADFDKSAYKNPSVANLFEPGSIFKVLVMAAALNEKVVTPDTICDICAGPIRIGQYTIKTWNEKYYPNTTLTDVIVHSDNIGMVFTARLLGKEKFARYLADFGIGQLTGIELQEEASGPKKLPTDLKDIDLATNSFGQGIAVTPIQMLTAVNAIANKGVLIRPTIIEKIISGDKEVSLPQIKKTKVIESEAASQIRDMMIAAVNRGEAKWARPKNIEIAGKTGTAQIPIAGHYDPEKTIASFVGFFPARRPQYTMLVSLTEPQTSPWGSETAAPLWFAIANQLLLLGGAR